MTLPILKITNGTTEVDLIQRGGNAFYLNAWRPAIAQLKGGGTWQQSSLSDGRRLVQAQWQNVIETFDLKIADLDPDAISRETQTLRRLLNEAIEFSTVSWKTDPVWLEARASNETNTRYALIHSWSTPDDENPFSQPFLQPAGARMMDRFTLTIERGHWLATAPGTETCVQLSSETEVFPTAELSFLSTEGESGDDAQHTQGGANWSIADTDLILGHDGAAAYNIGMRFEDVGSFLAPGATITNAFIRFEASANAANVGVELLIYGQDADDPAVFTTLADFVARPLTEASREWPSPFEVAIPTWTLGNNYDTPDISNIIQEIIDRPGWAAGQHIVIFIHDNGSGSGDERNAASWDHLTRAAPVLTISLQTGTSFTVGRSATCEDEVYVANKQNTENLRYIYVDDGGVVGANQVSSTSFNIYPAVPVANDAIYFGAWERFSSLIFDIIQKSGTVDTIWEYWTGGLWFQVFNIDLIDRTDIFGFGADSFGINGVNGVFWEQPNNWASGNLNTILGYGPAVTAYWIRSRVTNVAGPTGPEQQNREVYTVTSNSVLIDESQVGGDISALARHLLTDQAGNTNYHIVGYLPYTSRVICGVRSVSRGANFASILNCAPEQVGTQNPSGTVTYHQFDTADQAALECATGTAARYTPPAAPDTMAARVSFFFETGVGLEYLGEFHAYVRAQQNSGAAGDFEVQLTINVSFEEHAIETDIVPTYVTGEWMLLDMGRVTIPTPAELLQGEVFTISITIEASSTNAAATLDFYDLVLIPTDEWAGDFVDPDKATGRAASAFVPHELRVELDSVRNQKVRTRAVVEGVASDQVTSVWSTITNGPITLVQNEDQRLHFLFCYYTDAGVLISEPFMWDTVQSFKNQRYLSARGDR